MCSSVHRVCVCVCVCVCIAGPPEARDPGQRPLSPGTTGGIAVLFNPKPVNSTYYISQPTPYLDYYLRVSELS